MLAWAIFKGGIFFSRYHYGKKMSHVVLPSHCSKKVQETRKFFPEAAKRTSCLLKTDCKINLPDDTIWGIIYFKEAWGRFARI